MLRYNQATFPEEIDNAIVKMTEGCPDVTETLATANVLLGGYGIEDLVVGLSNEIYIGSYVNMGDPYANTLLWIDRTEEFAIGSWADMLADYEEEALDELEDRHLFISVWNKNGEEFDRTCGWGLMHVCMRGPVYTGGGVRIKLMKWVLTSETIPEWKVRELITAERLIEQNKWADFDYNILTPEELEDRIIEGKVKPGYVDRIDVYLKELRGKIEEGSSNITLPEIC